MNASAWHYAVGGEQQGPVGSAEFERLVAAGTVTADTLVWTEGMAAWEPWAKVRPAPAAAAPPVAGNVTAPPELVVGQARCDRCGAVVGADEVVPLDGRLVCAACKPLAVQMLKEGVAEVSPQAEEIRHTHLKHEASIRAVGLLQILGGAFFCFVGLALAVAVATGAYSTGPQSARPVVGVVSGLALFYALMAGVLLWLGFGLRRLKPSARIPAVVLSGIGLIGFPLGTLINAYILWLLLSQKGKTVFSDEYKRVITETPHVRYRTPVLLWILVALLIFFGVPLLLWFGMNAGPVR